MQQIHSNEHTSLKDEEHQIRREEQEVHSSQLEETPTALEEATLPQHQEKSTKRDWSQFIEKIAIPITIALFGTLLGFVQWQVDIARGEREQESALDNQRHQILSGYFDQMTELLLGAESDEENPGIDLKSNDEAKSIARARTLSTLRQLDGERKGQLLKFLYEAGLIGGQCKINSNLQADNCQTSILNLGGARLNETEFDRPISLPGVDLTEASLPDAILPEIDLTKASMQKANLSGANLEKAILFEAQMKNIRLVKANLIGANLSTAKLPGAVLKKADLQGAKLANAVLSNADLTNANLNNTNLRGADLTGADLTEASLQGSDLKDAIYNDATNFPEGFDPVIQGMLKQ